MRQACYVDDPLPTILLGYLLFSSILLFSLYTTLSLSYRVVKSYLVKPGKDFSTEVTKQETDLTPEMIQRLVHVQRGLVNDIL